RKVLIHSTKSTGHSSYLEAADDPSGESCAIPELPDVGASGNVVLRLAQPIPMQQTYKVFFDNWFTSVHLILTLSQHCAGNIPNNRLPGVNLMCEAELKRTGYGSFEQKMAMVGETTLHVVKRYDNH
ncbi:hypothetical protein L3Q82_026890, partial [Scortum barcoo]